MLAIHKDHKAIKAITAGSVAFAIGLTGAAAYTNSIIQHENLVFSQAQASKKTQPVTSTTSVQQATPPSSPASDSTGYYSIQPVQSGSAMSSAGSGSTGSVPVAPPANPPAVSPPESEPTSPPADTSRLCSDIVLPELPVPDVNCRLL